MSQANAKMYVDFGFKDVYTHILAPGAWSNFEGMQELKTC